MEPELGDYQLSTPVSAGTYYPSNGKGESTAVEAESFCRDANVSLITFVNTSSPSTGRHELTIFHGDGSRAAYYYGSGNSTDPSESFSVGPEGLLMRGNWYVTSAGASSRNTWNLGFKRLS